MEEKIKKVIVDTYTLIAIVYDEVGSGARKILEEIRKRIVKGIVPNTVAYEYTVHWLKGRIPALKNIDEVKTYLREYFNVINLDFEDYIKAAEIKVRGDELLKKAKIEELRRRRLSIVDSTIIALALREKLPILTGDKDLRYVAGKMGVKTIW
ncbi:MAG: PIN domain nuclease [Thermoprotei archaeon]|nr:MAG: PIN domain nuclease [Thermoprotei archaeon]